MKDKVFADTDIALNLLVQRHPHYDSAARLFTLADRGEVNLLISSLSFGNLHYLLSKKYSRAESIRKLRDFKVLVNMASVEDKTIELALNSSFTDFEDAIQYYAAIENGVSVLLTRNLRDYKVSDVPVMTAEDYIKIRRAN